MRDKWVVVYGLMVSPLIMGGLIFNYIDWSWGWDIPHFHTWAFFLYLTSHMWLARNNGLPYVFAAISLSSVWNDLLWGFWWNVPQTHYINPLSFRVSWSFKFFGQTLFDVTPALMFWSLIARVAFALGLIIFRIKRNTLDLDLTRSLRSKMESLLNYLKT